MQLLFHFLFSCIKTYTISISNKEWGNYTLTYLTVNLQGHFCTYASHMASHMWLSRDLCFCCIGQKVNHVCEACMLPLPFLHQCYWLVRKFRSKTLSCTLTKLKIRHNLMAHRKIYKMKGGVPLWQYDSFTLNFNNLRCSLRKNYTYILCSHCV